MTRSDEAVIRRFSDLGSLECMEAKFVTHEFPRHAHDTYVIEWVEAGEDRFFCKDAMHSAPAGTFVLINPLEVHTGSVGGTTALRYRSFYPSVEMMAEVRKQMRFGQELPLFPKTVIRDTFLENEFKKFWKSLDGRCSSLQRQCLLIMFLLKLIHRHANGNSESKPPREEAYTVRKIRKYIEEHYMETISLNELSDLAGWSPFYLLRAFRKETGLPPYEYMINVRIERAKHLLLQRIPIARVAHQTGFADQSHFTRFFKRIVGVTPGQYLS